MTWRISNQCATRATIAKADRNRIKQQHLTGEGVEKTSILKRRKTSNLFPHTMAEFPMGSRHWEWYFDEADSSGDPIEVEYQFDFGEKEVTYHNDGSGTPSSPVMLDLIRFQFKGVDVTKLIWALVTSEAIEDLEMEIMGFEEDGGGFDIEDFIE